MLRGHRALTMMFLAFWVLAGPVAMAFDSCAAMGAMCEGPCGLMIGAVVAPVSLGAPLPLASLELPARASVPVAVLAVLELPPKSLRLSA